MTTASVCITVWEGNLLQNNKKKCVKYDSCLYRNFKCCYKPKCEMNDIPCVMIVFESAYHR